MRPALLALVLLTAGLAGCTGSDDAGGAQDGRDGTPPAEPRELSLTLSPCNAIEAFAQIDPAVAREHVPDDFAIAPAGQDGRAVVILGGLRCGEDASGAERGFVAIQVEPRDEALSAEGITNYFWEPEHHLVPGNQATDAFLEVGAQAGNASHVNLTFEMTGTTMEIHARDVTHRVSSPAPTAPGVGQAAGMAPSFREYSAAEGGYAYLEAAFESGDPQHRGTAQPMQVQTASGTVARELLGTDTVLPTVAFEGFTYADAKVGFVPRPAP